LLIEKEGSMITIKNVKTLAGETVNYTIQSADQQVVEANGQLLLLPALCDAHIGFGPLGTEQWKLGVLDAIKGGITSVVDVPENTRPLPTKQNLEDQQQLIDFQLNKDNYPLLYQFYAPFVPSQMDQIGQIKKLIKGILIRLDRQEEEEALEDAKIWDRLFQLAAWEDVLVVMNALSENLYPGYKLAHRNISLLEKALSYVEKHSARLCFLNVSAKEEIELIKQAKARELLVFAETTPKYLFPKNAQEADPLWEAIEDGVIDMIGTGYQADLWKSEEKIKLNGNSLPITSPLLFLPLLIHGFEERGLAIDRIVQLARFNAQDICEIKDNQDIVLVDTSRSQKIIRNDGESILEISLTGWPVYTVVQGRLLASK
jgi:dihydroorotase